MAQTLIELGANLGAVNADGCDVLAVAALRGSFSLWTSLVEHVPGLLQRCSALHAGQVVQSAAQDFAASGDLEHFRAVLRFLQRGYALAGRGGDWLAQINTPLSRRYQLDEQQCASRQEQALGVLAGQGQQFAGTADLFRQMGAGNAPKQATVHALRTLLLVTRDKRAERHEDILRGMTLLLEAGVTLDVLRPSRPADAGSSRCSLKVLEVLAAHVLCEGTARQDGPALIGLLTLSIVNVPGAQGFEETSSGEPQTSLPDRLAKLLAQLAKRGADFRWLSDP
jgi:hypothetical protein